MSDVSLEFPGILRPLFHEIMTGHFYYKNLCSRNVSKMQTDVHKTKRMGAALVILLWFDVEINGFLKSIVTGYEMWISRLTPRRKQQSLYYCNGGILVLQKKKNSRQLFLKKNHVHRFLGLSGNFISGIHARRHINQHRTGRLSESTARDTDQRPNEFRRCVTAWRQKSACRTHDTAASQLISLSSSSVVRSTYLLQVAVAYCSASSSI